MFGSGAKSGLIQCGGCDRAEAVPGHLALVAEAIQREEQRVVADGLVGVAAWQDEPPPATELAQLLQERYGLLRERHDVRGDGFSPILL